MTVLDSSQVIKQMYEMKEAGMFVSEIAAELSKQTGSKVTQISIWRMLEAEKEKQVDPLAEYEYPSLEDYSYIFNTKMQKDKNSTTIKYEGITIRRDLMLRILNKFYKVEFTYYDVRRDLNDRNNEENFLAHWNYLLKNHYIESVSDYKFTFCDRVRKWKTFGQL